MQIGCCVPIEKDELIAGVGFDYVEFPAWQVAELTDEQVRQVSERIGRTGVPCRGLNAYCKGRPAIVGDGFDPAETEAYAERLMANAQALGVSRVGIGAPPARRLPEGYDPALADSQCEQFLRITARVAAEHGIDILLEAIQHGMCNYMNGTGQALAMVQKLALDNLRLVVDLYHMETEGEDWKDLAVYVPWTLHMHVSTVGQGLARGMYRPGDEEYCGRTFRAIAASGYDGTVSVEPDASALTAEDAGIALDLMRRAWSQAKAD